MSSVVTLVEAVENMFDKKPDKRKKTEYKDWKKTINLLIEDLNKSCKFKMYEKIK
jgi:hypothetical protein